MLKKLHQNAKTNYAIRREIQSSSQSISSLAHKFNLSWLTVKKWKEREFVEDKSSRPEKFPHILDSGTGRPYILTDNGLEFCYKALYRKTKRIHPFVTICKQNKIQHRTIKFRHPWTNGMVERFNGKIKKNVIRRYLFENENDLKDKLICYLNKYNLEVKLKQLSYKTPADYLKETKNISIQCIVT